MAEILGNIVTSNKRLDYGGCFKIVPSMDDIEEGKPAIIIGKEEAKETIGDGFNVLEKSYKDGLVWWTYKKTERRSDFETDIADFICFCVNRFKDSLKYIYVDIPRIGLYGVKRFIAFMDSDELKKCKVTYGNKFMFIYSEKRRTVYGLSLTLCEYNGVKCEKVIERVKKNRRNIFVYDGGKIDSMVRRCIGGDEFIIPALV